MNLSGAKMRMAHTIIDTVRNWTGGQGDARPLISIADRESAFNPKAEGDMGVAAKVWEREKPRFERAGNPWTHLDREWSASRGLYQLMVPYHMPKWNEQAHPLVFENPIVATIVAARLINTAHRMGAKTPVDVRMIWAFGGDGLRIAHTDPRYVSRLKLETERMTKLGFSPSLATEPISNLRLQAFGTEHQEGQEAKANALSEVLGFGPIVGQDETIEPPTSRSPLVPLLALGAMLWGMHRG